MKTADVRCSSSRRPCFYNFPVYGPPVRFTATPEGPGVLISLYAVEDVVYLSFALFLFTDRSKVLPYMDQKRELPYCPPGTLSHAPYLFFLLHLV
jgi:hypothetical protein